jgi:hypothetical protein
MLWADTCTFAITSLLRHLRFRSSIISSRIKKSWGCWCRLCMQKRENRLSKEAVFVLSRVQHLLTRRGILTHLGFKVDGFPSTQLFCSLCYYCLLAYDHLQPDIYTLEINSIDNESIVLGGFRSTKFTTDPMSVGLISKVHMSSRRWSYDRNMWIINNNSINYKIVA